MSNLYILDVHLNTIERVQVVADNLEEAYEKVGELGGIEDSEVISSSIQSVIFVEEDRWD